MKVLLLLSILSHLPEDLPVTATLLLGAWTSYRLRSLLNSTFIYPLSCRRKLISWLRVSEELLLTGWSLRLKQITRLNWKLDSVTISKKILMALTLPTLVIGMKNTKQWKPFLQSRLNKEFREIELSIESIPSSLKPLTREPWQSLIINWRPWILKSL